MDYQKRYMKLRALLKQLNQRHKVQTQKIDILCNDFVSAQRNFIRRLATISFAAFFYESIASARTLQELLEITSELFRDQTNNSNVSVFLSPRCGTGPCQPACNCSASQEHNCLKGLLDENLIEEICRTNRPCKLEDLYGLGLQGNPKKLASIHASTVPLSLPGISLGFVLICNCSGKVPAEKQLSDIQAVCPGLSKAVESCLGVRS